MGSSITFSASFQTHFLSTEWLSCRFSEMRGSTAMLGLVLGVPAVARWLPSGFVQRVRAVPVLPASR